jgi:hypothetical protein
MADSFWTIARRSIARNLLPSIAIIVLIAFLIVAMVEILSLDTSVPVSNTDLEAAARANERLLQMTQWTLTTVLGLGLALIAINWYQSTRDRSEIDEIEHALRIAASEYEEQLRELMQSADELWKRMAEQQLNGMVLSAILEGKDDNAVASYFRLFHEFRDERVFARAAAEGLIEVARESLDSPTVRETLMRLLPELRAFDQILALDVAQLLAAQAERSSQELR